MELDKTSLSSGCLAANEVMFMILPQFFAFMYGVTSRQQFTTLINSESNVSCQSLSVVSLKSADGGPHVLLTRMSILLNLVAVALTMA
jgi:hypothetical protein